jgi:hypothetical protein
MVDFTGAGAPTGPTGPAGPSVSTENAGRQLLHYLALEILENLSTQLSKGCLQSYWWWGRNYCRLGLLFYKVKHRHTASGCSTHSPRKEGWCRQNTQKCSFNLLNSKSCSG